MVESGRVIYLVHHADALSADVEPQQPLSVAGRVHAESLAERARDRGVKPQVIWHSGKLRARQTAEPFHRLCNPLAEFSAIRGLQPTDPPEWIEKQLTDDQRDVLDVLLVGHMPGLPRILTRLITGAHDVPVPFPLHGMIALVRDGERWQELWRMT
jgi:phosphohistidine phosphatase